MSDPSTGPVARKLQRAIGADAGEPDDALLSRFAERGDESAFELLVSRHAGFVQRVCYSVLRDRHAAEDACQATFLVLARKAAGLRGATVTGWLYKVARRIAVKYATSRRATSELQSDAPAPPVSEEPDADTARAVHEEIDRLPERYRVPVVACLIEGLTYAEAAARLGWPLGTVAGRLSRAKELLEQRLTARGLGATAALAALALPTGAEAVSPAVLVALSTALEALAAGRVADLSPVVRSMYQGEMKTMFATRLLTALTASMVLGAAMVAAAQLNERNKAEPVPKPNAPAELIVGKWSGTGEKTAVLPPDKKGPAKEYAEKLTVEFGKDGTYRLVSAGIPELKRAGKTVVGTYKFVSGTEIEIAIKLAAPKVVLRPGGDVNNAADYETIDVERTRHKFAVTKGTLELVEATVGELTADAPRVGTFTRLP